MRTLLYAALALLSSGCWRDLPSYHPDDAGVDGAAQDAAHDGGGELLNPDGGAESRRVRWVPNGPEGDIEEGPVEFALLCVDEQGESAACAFECSYDGAAPEPCADRYELFWAEPGLFVTPRDHAFCVRASPVAPGREATTTCRNFRSLPYRRAYTWDAVMPSSRSTAFELPLRCKRPSEGGGDEVGAACTFRCSVDGAPFSRCEGSFARDRLAPDADHVLRVETRGPFQTLEMRFARVTTVRFHTDEDALPFPGSVDGDFRLPLLELEELEARGFGEMLEAYTTYAPACASLPVTRDQAIESMQVFLSDVLGSPHTQIGPSYQIDACTEALSRRPVECRGLPGVGPTSTHDGSLIVRLPLECNYFYAGSLMPGERCNSHADCSIGRCEWTWEYESKGICAEDAIEDHEGIRCSARGCGEGLYCGYYGTCERILDPGAECHPNLENLDCPQGYVCAGGDVTRCVERTGG